MEEDIVEVGVAKLIILPKAVKNKGALFRPICYSISFDVSLAFDHMVVMTLPRKAHGFPF